jgi:mannose-6-phosphate isomerase-like protein (cupin superfamily)
LRLKGKHKNNFRVVYGKSPNVNGGRIKETIITFVFAWFTANIFIEGFAANHGGFMMPTEKKVCIMDLQRDAEYQDLLCGRPQTCGMRSGRVYLQTGEACGQHSTDHHEEMLVFLSGQGVALIGEEQSAYLVGEGKVSYIPPHTTHNIKNTGAKPLVYIYCVAPLID